MTGLRTLLCRLSFAISLLLAACGASAAAPALFRVSDADSHIWLFGSIHFLDAKRAWRTPEFNTALKESDFVYFEMPITDGSSAKMMELTMSYGFYRDGMKLPDYLSDGQRFAFDEAMTKAGLDPRTFDTMRPWMVELVLGQMAVSEGFGGAPQDLISQGVEMTIAGEIADERERAFEAVETQFRLISGGTDAEHVASLMAAIEAEPAASFDPMSVIDIWISGDLDGMHRLLTDAMPADGPVYRRMLTDRNRRWAAQMATMLAANESAIVIVGAGHLAGPSGLPAFLAEHGLTVERVVTTPSATPQSRSQSR